MVYAKRPSMVEHAVSQLILWVAFLQLPSSGMDTIYSGQSLNISGTISSAAGHFELGFFSPGKSPCHYVGIWFKRVSRQTVVWVANRDFPLFSGSPSLALQPDGSLVIREGRITYAVTNASAAAGNASVTLLDTGNLVLRDRASDTVLWQSFDDPSDTILPGMKLGYDKRNGKIWSLVSWKSLEEPRRGAFEMQLDPGGIGQLLITQGKKIYWTSGAWNGTAFGFYSEEHFKKLSNIRYVSNRNQSYITFSSFKGVRAPARIMLDVSGQIKEETWDEKNQQWTMNWSQPAQQCQVYAYCGSFGTCRRNVNHSCSCVQGFIPRNPRLWDLRDMSESCLRKVPLACNIGSRVGASEVDGFLPLHSVVLPVNPVSVVTGDAKACRSRCLANCSCSAYAHISDGCHTWGRELFNLQQLADDDPEGRSLFIKLAASELNGRGTTNRWWFPLLLSLLLILILMLSVGFLIFLRRRRKYQKIMGMDLLQFDMDNSPWSPSSDGSKNNGRGQDCDLPLFSFVSVSAVTGDFSAANKLGEGGFGPVYKGKLQSGYEVAVKRLSKRSGQGLEELKNEATLIAKLQHKNLVRLLGCCLDQDEKILIYEYLQNRSLDFFLFDPLKRRTLDWQIRIRIINGIAQGLLYLHEYSRLRIIHRDLKASNILLDQNMNPKISDFGMARIFGEDDPLATNRIVGTYGYMSPEYAMDGIFSVKSDVFSFGILMLEILSGKKNSGLYTEESPNLLGSAWDLWKRGMVVQLMDPYLEEKPCAEAQYRYMTVALLCAQECAADRPAMSVVTSMLGNESVVLPRPKLPKSSIIRSVMDSDSSATMHGSVTVNDNTGSVDNTHLMLC